MPFPARNRPTYRTGPDNHLKPVAAAGPGYCLKSVAPVISIINESAIVINIKLQFPSNLVPDQIPTTQNTTRKAS